ncbi:unnamed protein product [Rotaria sp. Silwood2]|nr:unnamed protein product [Rotaria sp. Silwood2]
MFFIVESQTTTLWNDTYPKGEVIRVKNVDVYTVGNNTDSTKDLSVIVIYDIFGFNISQTRVFCDRLSAEYKVKVAMPDFFRGKTASSHMSNLSVVLSLIGNWSQVSTDLSEVASWLQNTSPSHRIAVIGFCWGGLQVVRACSNLSTLFFTGISIHGAWLTEDEVRHLQQPILFIAAGDDPPLKPNISNVIEKWTSPRVANQCQYETYPNMIHGFVSTGANYSNADNVKAVDDVHEKVRHFLDRISRNSASSTYHSMYFLLLFSFCFFLI